MTNKKHLNPWKGWRPNTGKKYDPNDPHFNPFYPPEDTPLEVLEAFWGKEGDKKDDEPKP